MCTLYYILICQLFILHDIYIYIYAHTHTYIHAYIHVYTYTYIPIHIHIYIHIYIYIYIYTHTYTYTYTYTYIYTQGKLGVGIIFRKDPYGLFHVLTIAKGSPAEACGVINKGTRFFFPLTTQRYSVCFLAKGSPAEAFSVIKKGTQVSCFTGTKVQILTLRRPAGWFHTHKKKGDVLMVINGEPAVGMSLAQVTKPQTKHFNYTSN